MSALPPSSRPPGFGGRGNGKLEIFKFCLYVSIPVVASIIYGTPENMQSIVNKFRFVEYPAEDTRGGDVLVGQSISREERAKAVATAAAGREAGKEGGRPQEEKKGGWGGLWRK